jgi:DNA-binding protein H-NS
MANKTKTELMEEIENKNKEIKDLKKEIEKLDRYRAYEDGANEIAAFRDSLVAAGFTKTEAFELTKIAINSAMGLATKSVTYKRYC